MDSRQFLDTIPAPDPENPSPSTEREQSIPFLNLEERERLALLLEELGEAAAAVGKILRHGYEAVNPEQMNGLTNRQALEKELADVRHAMILMCVRGDLSRENIHETAHERISKVKRWMHHQEPRVPASLEDAYRRARTTAIHQDEPIPTREQFMSRSGMDGLA